MNLLTAAALVTLSAAPALADGVPAEGRNACLNAARQQSELKQGKLDVWSGTDSEFNGMGEWLVIFTYEIEEKPVQVRCLWNPDSGSIVLGAFGGKIYDSTK